MSEDNKLHFPFTLVDLYKGERKKDQRVFIVVIDRCVRAEEDFQSLTETAASLVLFVPL